ARALAHPLEPGDAADGVKRDVAGANPVLPGHQGMAQLVQGHAAENGRQQDRGIQNYRQSSTGPVGKDEPAQQQEQRPVNVNTNPKSSTDSPGTQHVLPSFLVKLSGNPGEVGLASRNHCTQGLSRQSS